MKNLFIISVIISILFLSGCINQNKDKTKTNTNAIPKDTNTSEVIIKDDLKNESIIKKSGSYVTDNEESEIVPITKNGCYHKSNMFIYYMCTTEKENKIANADLSSFEVIESDQYNIAKDNNYVYWGNKIINSANPGSIEYLGYSFSKDNNNVYSGDRIIEKVDVETVKLVGLDCGDERDVYLIDRNNVYIRTYTEEKGVEYIVFDNADPDTFEYIPWENNTTDGSDCLYTKDKNHVYRSGEIIEGADPNNYTPN